MVKIVARNDQISLCFFHWMKKTVTLLPPAGTQEMIRGSLGFSVCKKNNNFNLWLCNSFSCNFLKCDNSVLYLLLTKYFLLFFNLFSFNLIHIHFICRVIATNSFLWKSLKMKTSLELLLDLITKPHIRSEIKFHIKCFCAV